MRKIFWIIVFILICSPIFINYVILGVSVGAEVNGSIDGWLGFYGTLIGTLITMFVLYCTRKWNKEDNNETRDNQNKILKYQSKVMWLDNFKKQLDENYKVLDFQSCMIAVEQIMFDNFEGATNRLSLLVKNLEMQAHSFDLYLHNENISECEQEYLNYYDIILKEYGDFVNDLITICKLKQSDEKVEYIRYSVEQYSKLKFDDIKVEPSEFLLKLHELITSNADINKINDICANRVMEVSFIQSHKIKLAKLTKKILIYEENQVVKLLP